MLVGVADGLSAAHAAGILHRDIKPENILIAKNGYGKLADFGVAKLTKTAEADIASQLTEGQSRPGVIIGTIAYMSPEQASGHAVDGRSDIFSFGVILYELLCGRRPFTGTTDLMVLQNIIHRPAEPLGDQLPLLLRIAVDKALAKDPAERYQTMRDFVVDLKRASRINLTQAPLEPVVSRHRYWFAGVVTIITLIAAVSWWFFRMSATLENPLANARFTRLTDFPGYEEDAAISPDGKFVTFLSDRDGRYDIWPSPLATGQFFNLTNGKEKESIVMVRKIGFSGDGSHIWLAGGGEKLRLMPLMGGQPRPFVGDVVNVAWSADGTRLVYHTADPGDPMFVADKTGSNRRQILVAQLGVHHHYPAWSPDDTWIYFARGYFNAREMDLWRVPSSGGTAERLTEMNTDLRYPAPLSER